MINLLHIRKLIVVLPLLMVAGCQRYEWVHPTKNLEQFGRDRLVCEEKAARLYPAEPVTIREPGMFIDRGFPTCWRTASGQKRCHMPQPVYIPPTYRTDDLNEDDRKRAIEACLFSKGYQLVPTK